MPTLRLVALFASFVFAISLAAQTPAKRLVLADYLEWEDVADPQLSPDGREVVYTRRWVDKLNDKWEASLSIMNTDGSRNRFLVNGSSPKWSPNGTRLAYLAKGEPTGTQLFVRSMDAEGGTTQLTRVTETPADLEWSPDGKSLAFRMLVLSSEKWDIGMPAAGPRGPSGPRRRVSSRDSAIDWMGEGYVDDGYRHLFVVPADRRGPPPPAHERRLRARAAAMEPRRSHARLRRACAIPMPSYKFNESEVYAVDVASGDVKQLTKRNGPDGDPWSRPMAS